MPGNDIAKRPVNPPAVIPEIPWDRSRESEALIPRAFRAAKRNRHLTVPLAVPPATWTAGEILHAAGLTMPTAVGGGVLAAAVWFFAPHKWDRRAEQWYARLTVTSAAAWLTAAAHWGASSGLAGMILGGILVTDSGGWGFLWWRHYRPRGRRRREKMLAKWDAWWQGHAHAWSLYGSRVIAAHESGVTIRLRVQLWAGRQSVQHVQQSVHLIESALQGIADIGMIRVEAVKGNPSQVDLFFKQANPLAAIVEYDPALAPQSVHENYAAGLTETGAWKTRPLRCNRFVIGETRSGKSNDLLVGLAALTGCQDDRQILIDLKGGRSARPVLKAAAVDYVVTEVDEARLVLLMLVAEAKARAKYAYVDDEEQLRATDEIPAIHLLIDEVHGLTSVPNGDAECARLLGTIASQGMGLEEYTWVYTQHGSLEESVRTEQTRANLTFRTVYRVAEARHGAYVIPEYNKLDASKLEEKGTSYDKDGPKASPEQVRAPHMPHALLKQAAAANARRLAPRPHWMLYCGTEPCPAGGTWQEWWDARWLRLDVAFRADSPQYRAALEDAPEDAEQVLRDASDAIDAAPASVPGEGDGRSVAARIEAETGGEDFSPDRRIVSRMGDVIRAQKEAFADALSGAREGISVPQLQEESGRGRTAVYDMLTALAEAGAVVQLRRGLYAPAPGADIHEAIAAVEAGNEALLKDAKRQVKKLRPVS